MFERKNQGILSEHYNKLVDRGSDDSDMEDDFITLKRADHDLPGDATNVSSLNPIDHEDISKRKLKIGQSRSAMLKYKSGGTKLVFDEEGGAHPMYEMQDEAAFKNQAGGDVLGAGKAYVEEVRSKMQDADLLDKAEARDKKKEKKRKRKEREAEVCSVFVSHCGMLLRIFLKLGKEGSRTNGPTVDMPESDDGYISPNFDDFDLPSGSDDDAPVYQPPSKRSKARADVSVRSGELENDESLALKMLRGEA